MWLKEFGNIWSTLVLKKWNQKKSTCLFFKCNDMVPYNTSYTSLRTFFFFLPNPICQLFTWAEGRNYSKQGPWLISTDFFQTRMCNGQYFFKLQQIAPKLYCICCVLCALMLQSVTSSFKDWGVESKRVAYIQRCHIIYFNTIFSSDIMQQWDFLFLL